MLKIITISSEADSAQKIGLPTIVGNVEERVEVYNNDIFIRWGNSKKHYNREGIRADFLNVLNPAINIKKNCNKYNSTVKLETVVKTPKVYRGFVPSDVSVVVRPIEHTGGNDFLIKKGELDLEWEYYASQFIETDTEVRVWFCGDKTLCGKRIPMKDQDPDDPCRSKWNYLFLFNNTPKKLHDATLKATKILGLEFGAADVLFKDGEYYFLELNAAPTLDRSLIIKFFRNNIFNLAKEKFGDKFEELAELNKIKSENPDFLDF